MRKGFTLVELIFVIVIIGILAAAAIPQFTNLKQSAEANSIVKTTIDGAASAAAAAVNQLDLEDTVPSALQLNQLVRINGKGWSYSGTGGTGTYTYKDGTNNVAQIDFNATGRTVIYGVDCEEFVDDESKSKCGQVWTDTNATNAVTLKF